MNSKLLSTIILCALSSFAVMASDDKAVTDTIGTLKAVIQSPAEMLKGQISGVRVSAIDGNPNGEYNVNVRGINTLRGDSQPIWVVDGVILGSSVNQNLNAFFQTGGTSSTGASLPDYSGYSYTSPLGNFGWLNPYDIESIEVVKDLSELASYGLTGANGVIIVTTRKPKEERDNVHWASNMVVNVPSVNGDSFHTGFSHNHELALNGVTGVNSWYNISAFLRRLDSGIENDNSTGGGVSVNYCTEASKLFHFGLNSYVAYEDGFSAAGVNYLGSPSTMVLEKYPDLFSSDTVQGYLDDYDDKLKDFRTVNSVWLRINFLPGFYFKATGGVDYQNQTRYFWYGTKTSFGDKFNGANAILNNSLFTYNGKAELVFDRNFLVKNHVSLTLSADINGNQNRTNDMCGTDFDLKSLRWRSIQSAGSSNSIRKFDRKYSELGAAAVLGYDYDRFFGINATFRIDRNTRFDKSPIFFPAASAYIDFARAFFKGNRTLSTLKFSAGYGKAGREVVLPYEYLDAYIDGVPYVQQGLEYYYDGMNRLLSSEVNAGINLGLLSDRFTIGVKYYNKSTEDIFRIFNSGKVVSQQYVQTSNWTVLQERLDEIGNRGVEVDACADVISKRSVSWTMYADAAFNKISECFLSDYVPEVYGGFGSTLRIGALTMDAKLSGASAFNIRTLYASEKGDYLRLDNVSVSYDVPLKVKWIKRFSVNAAARNLLTLTEYSGWNPDVNCFGVNVRNYGYDYGSYPLVRSFVLGVSVNF